MREAISTLDRVSERALGGALTAALAVAYLGLFAAWVPQYLTWPWWNDLDHFATYAMAWDAGVLPYRDLPSFQFPGEYYLFWVVGKAFGWGRTAPLYAVDASFLLALGVASAAWSHRRLGRALQGVVGYGVFLGYYLNVGIELAAQRDWHAALFSVLGLFVAEALPGRAGLTASALALAASLSIRPYSVLLAPAFVFAIDESSRSAGGSKGLRIRAVVEWGAMVSTFVALAFAPLVVSGVFHDFVRGLRETALGSPYNKLTVSSFFDRLTDELQGHRRVTAMAAAVAVLAFKSVPGRRRTVLTWVVAFVGSLLYRPISPGAQAYLTFNLIAVSSVISALLVGTILEWPGRSPTSRLSLIILVLFAGVPTWPRYVSPSRSLHAMTAEAGIEFPRVAPACGDAAYRFYSWKEYRDTIIYLRRSVAPGVRVANVLNGLPAVTGPVGRLPPFPGESLAWFQYFKNQPDLEDAYIRRLQDTPVSVVVWSPREVYVEGTIVPRRLAVYIESTYAFEARFGSIEVWQRKEVSKR